ncbi:GNAT family N-acetyltransferase [Roseibium salinum]|nr:GNAT family N-acetyltransferase [Roseibium salinum]
MLLKSGDVVGSVMTGYDGHRGSVYYLSIHPDHQSAGLGQMLMKHCEDFLIELGCPKINLFVRRDNEAVMRFYEQLGYSEEAAVPLGKKGLFRIPEGAASECRDYGRQDSLEHSSKEGSFGPEGRVAT